MPKSSCNHHGRNKQFVPYLGIFTVKQVHRKIISGPLTVTGSNILQSNRLELIRNLRKIYV